MTAKAPLVVVGDALLDVDVDGSATRLCPDAPVPVLDTHDERARPGGAGLAALLAAVTGSRPVTLITPLGPDDGSARLRELLAPVQVIGLPTSGAVPVKTRVLAGTRPLVRLDSGGLGVGPWDLTDAAAALDGAAGVLVSDYGRGATADPALRELLTATARWVPVVWDPHPRGAAPVPGAALVTPNLAEAGATSGEWLSSASAAAATLRERWSAEAVVVTAGVNGAVLRSAAGVGVVPAPPATGGDPCGAGDRFAAAAALALAGGSATDDAVAAAVAAASAFVSGGGAAAVRRDDHTWRVPGGSLAGRRESVARPGDADVAVALAEAARARGGRVVATGGCFDLLHAGHARTLAAARDLGGDDGVLVVCLNSDDSVRRLKGATRPIVGEHDRAELLAALGCVDAVAVFTEDDPQTLIARLRPDVWVKGGDYAADDLPEAPLVRSWGGEVVAVPYHAGRSSTRLARSLEAVSSPAVGGTL